MTQPLRHFNRIIETEFNRSFGNFLPIVCHGYNITSAASFSDSMTSESSEFTGLFESMASDDSTRHCLKIVQIRRFFWSVFSRIRTECGEIRSISPYSVRIRENTEQKTSVFGHFSRSVKSDDLQDIHFLKIYSVSFELQLNLSTRSCELFGSFSLNFCFVYSILSQVMSFHRSL